MTREIVDSAVIEIGLPEAAKRFKVGAILFTYRCTINCRHCLFGCAADRPDVVMNPSQCLEALEMLHETGRVIHIAGGEAMMYWNELKDSIRLAGEHGQAPHFIETNCSFAIDDEVVRSRFEFMRDNGVMGIYASADPFHQEHVPPDRFIRVRSLTREIFGENRFFGPNGPDEDILGLQGLIKDENRLSEMARGGNLMMVGSASSMLSRYLYKFSPVDPALPRFGWGGKDAVGCLSEFLADSVWEIHIDPYGNIQTNCGIILGNVREIRLARLMKDGPEKANRFVGEVCSRGALGLAELARREFGFEIPERVAQECELCYFTRKHLRRYYPDIFGPAEVYG